MPVVAVLVVAPVAVLVVAPVAVLVVAPVAVLVVAPVAVPLLPEEVSLQLECPPPHRLK
jgi:hypothetical protein